MSSNYLSFYFSSEKPQPFTIFFYMLYYKQKDNFSLDELVISIIIQAKKENDTDFLSLPCIGEYCNAIYDRRVDFRTHARQTDNINYNEKRN